MTVCLVFHRVTQVDRLCAMETLKELSLGESAVQTHTFLEFTPEWEITLTGFIGWSQMMCKIAHN